MTKILRKKGVVPKPQKPDAPVTHVPEPSIPTLSPLEDRVLAQIVEWADEYNTKKELGDRLASHYKPTTQKCSTHFRYVHTEMLDLLNRLESHGLVRKNRRLSAGISGNGYDGSLHSEVLPTNLGRKVLALQK